MTRWSSKIFAAAANGVLPALAVLIVLVVGILIQNSIRVQYAELEWRFLRSGLLDGRVSSNHMIALLTNQQRRYFEEVRQEEIDLAEQIIRRGMQSNEGILRHRLIQMSALAERVNRVLINAVRFMTGDAPLPTEEEMKALALLGQAFLLEFDREYAQAIRLYDDILALRTKDSRLEDLARLHKGFCLAMQGFFAAADREYARVIAAQKDNDLGVTASLLQQFSQTIELERQTMRNSGRDALERAEKMALLGQCDLADSMLVVAGELSAEKESRRYWIRGQCFEFRGDKKRASGAYLKAIALGGDLDVARNANRRLWILGERMHGAERKFIQQISGSLNTVLRDSAYDVLIENSVSESPAERIETGSATRDSGGVISPEKTWIAEIEQLSLAAQMGAQRARNAEVDTIADSQQSLKPIAHKSASLLRESPWDSTGAQVSLRTVQGRVFSGVVVSEPGAMLVRLRTMIGIVAVPRNQLDTTAR